MSVPKESTAELRQIHQQLTGELLTEADAQAMAEELFRLFLAAYEPVPQQWLEELPDQNNHFTHNP